ncbi:MAG: glycosyltransferase family 2 protein [Bacteroidales bacterium]|nr:glycosyltransferase family 2 protein [Bacteroidales bacterium]
MTEMAIVILNWNTKEQLETFLPSIISFSQDESVEIIVADNGSKDGSAAFLRDNYPHLRTILFEKNYGFTGGYNKALAQVEAKYYVILNSDIEVTENWLLPLKKCLEEDGNAAACMPKVKSYHKREFFEYAGAAGGFIDKYGYPFCRGRIMDTVEKDVGQYDEQSDIFWTTGACMVIRADLFHQLGGFDDDFFAHMEEIDLCWRLKKLDYSIKYIPQSVVYHVGGGTLPNEHSFKLFLNYRNNLFLLYKNLPAKKLFPVLLVRILMDWLSAVIFLLNGKTKNFMAVLRSHNQFMGSLKRLKKKRKRNPSQSSDYPGQVFAGSIVYQYFLKKKTRFSELRRFL